MQDRSYASEADPLHYAAQSGNMVALSSLIKEPDFQTELKREDRNKLTPTLYAAVYGQLEVLKKLVEHKADVSDFSTEGYAAIHLAAEYDHAEIISYLIQDCKVSPNQIMKNCGGNSREKNSPCMLAVFHGNLDAVTKLVEHKADINYFNTGGYAAVHFGARVLDSRIMSYLINNCKVDINLPSRNKNAATPCQVAAKYGSVDVLKMIIEHKGNVNYVDKRGFAAIHYAAESGHVENIYYLFKEHKANPNIKTYGQSALTPYQIAAANGHFDALKKLTELAGGVNSDPKGDMEDGPSQIVAYLQNLHKPKQLPIVSSPSAKQKSDSPEKAAEKREKKLQKEKRRKERRREKKELAKSQHALEKNANNSAQNNASNINAAEMKVAEPEPYSDSSDDEDSIILNQLNLYAITKSNMPQPKLQPLLDEDAEGFQPVPSKRRNKQRNQDNKPKNQAVNNRPNQPVIDVNASQREKKLNPPNTTSRMLPLPPELLQQVEKNKAAASAEGQPAELPVVHAKDHAEGQPATFSGEKKSAASLMLNINQSPEGQPSILNVKTVSHFQNPSKSLFFRNDQKHEQVDDLLEKKNVLKSILPTVDLSSCQFDDTQQYLLIFLNLKQANELGLRGIQVEEVSVSSRHWNAKIHVKELMKQHAKDEQSDDLNEPGSKLANFF